MFGLESKQKNALNYTVHKDAGLHVVRNAHQNCTMRGVGGEMTCKKANQIYNRNYQIV